MVKNFKEVPIRKIVIQDSVNIEILKKLVLLNNHYVQYHVTPYEEVFMVANDEDIIYFETDLNLLDCPHDIIKLNKFIVECCEHPSISKVNMQTANKMWKNLKAFAAKEKAKNDRQKANGK